MNFFAHVNHAAERAFWKGPQSASAETPSGVRPADATRPDRSELPSDDPAGDVHPCQREM